MTMGISAEAAADWWVEQIRAVRPERPEVEPAMTTGQVLDELAIAYMRANDIDRHRVTDDTLAVFRTELVHAVAEAAKAATDGCVCLIVDYHPEELLAEAAEAAGIDDSQFPHKTRMRIYDDHVTAKTGYGARHRLIWSAEGWQHPECGDQRWDDEGPTGPPCGQAMWHDGRHDWESR